MTNGFTPTQQAILEVLKDGRPHSYEELRSCLPDELSGLKVLRVHICHIRSKLRPNGYEIICEWFQRRRWYRWVSLLPVNPLRINY